MPESCFVETTVLVEALLKSSENRKKARAAIRAYDKSILPIYAIKEMKAGALRNFIWAHNKLSETKSFRRTLIAVQRAFMSRYRQSTALEALQVGAELFTGASNDSEMAGSYRLSILYRISSAWRERRKLTTHTADELTCFAETGPVYNDRTALLEDDRRSCDLEPRCCLAPILRKEPHHIEALLDAIKTLSRPEDNKRREALHTLKNTPNRDFPATNSPKAGPRSRTYSPRP